MGSWRDMAAQDCVKNTRQQQATQGYLLVLASLVQVAWYPTAGVVPPLGMVVLIEIICDIHS